MTPQTPKHAPDALESANTWISCAAAAVVFGVSERTIWRRARAGQLTGRKVSSERGGLVWEIEVDATGQPTSQTDRPTSIPTEQPTGQNAAAAAIDVQTDRPKPTDRPAKTERPTDKPTDHAPDFAARYMEHLEKENEFLRRALEGAQQSEAMTKAALREALKAMPKQLTRGGGGGDDLQQVTTDAAAISGQNGTGNQNEFGQVGTTPAIDQSGPKSTAKPAHEQNHALARDDAQNGDISTYGALADWLENQL